MKETTQGIAKKIKRIQIQTTRLATDLLAGSYHSAFKGKGIEFEEVREYQEGDEIRHIDWNVTARMNDPYVKIFREERKLSVMLIVDASKSCCFGKKREWMAEIGGVLAFSAIKNNDKVGLILFTDQVEKYIPPAKGTRHVLRLIRELLLFEPKNQTSNLPKALTFFAHIQKQAGICFVLSDFIQPNYMHEMKLLAKKHDLIAIHISDPRERAVPKMGLVKMKDLETKETSIVDTSDPTVHKQLKQSYLDRVNTLKEVVKKTGIGVIAINSEEPYLLKLHRFFKLRELKK